MALLRVTGSRCHCGSHRKLLSLQLGWSRAAELCVPAAQSLQRLQRGYKPHLGMWGVPKPHRGCWNSRLRTSSPKFLLSGAGISRGICCPTKTLQCPYKLTHSFRALCAHTETDQLQQGQPRELGHLQLLGHQQHHKFQRLGNSQGSSLWSLLTQPCSRKLREASVTDLASLEL